MFLSAYSGLIKHLPYLDHSFDTKRETWEREHYTGHEEFSLFLKETFATDTVTFSRRDLFNVANEDFKAAIFSIIFWGYPRNMRGNSFKAILTSLPDIEKLLSETRDLDVTSYTHVCQRLKGKGIGLSTLSKFLYFFGFRIDENPCLILDSRIIEVLNARTFVELRMNEIITDRNKEGYYPDYLKIMEGAAKKYNCSVHQLELFLFMFGRNLKSATA